MARKNLYKCYFCLKRKMRYTVTHRICDACGTTQKKVGRGNHRTIRPDVLRKSRMRGAIKSLAIGNRRTALAPAIEALLRVE